MLYQSKVYWLTQVLCLFGTADASRPGLGLRHEHEHAHAIRANSPVTLDKRGPPTGWSVHVQNGNDGGGCYVENESARLLTEYAGNDPKNGLESCLSTCQVKGFKFGGVQYGSQCYVSPPAFTFDVMTD